MTPAVHNTWFYCKKEGYFSSSRPAGAATLIQVVSARALNQCFLKFRFSLPVTFFCGGQAFSFFLKALQEAGCRNEKRSIQDREWGLVAYNFGQVTWYNIRGIILVDKQMNGKRRKEDPYKECWI